MRLVKCYVYLTILYGAEIWENEQTIRDQDRGPGDVDVQKNRPYFMETKTIKDTGKTGGREQTTEIKK